MQKIQQSGLIRGLLNETWFKQLQHHALGSLIIIKCTISSLTNIHLPEDVKSWQQVEVCWLFKNEQRIEYIIIENLKLLFIIIIIFFLIIGCFIPLHNKALQIFTKNIFLSLNTQIDKNTKCRN